jgi:hypothetical protein
MFIYGSVKIFVSTVYSVSFFHANEYPTPALSYRNCTPSTTFACSHAKVVLGLAKVFWHFLTLHRGGRTPTPSSVSSYRSRIPFGSFFASLKNSSKSLAKCSQHFSPYSRGRDRLRNALCFLGILSVASSPRVGGIAPPSMLKISDLDAIQGGEMFVSMSRT